RDVQFFPEQVGSEGRGQRYAVDQQRVANGRPEQAHGDRDGDAAEQAARGREQEAQDRVAKGETTTGRRGDRHGQGGQGGGIVEEPFSLDDRDQLGRQADPAPDGQRGYRVGRGQGRAERGTGGQAHSGDEQLHAYPGDHGGGQDQPDGQADDRPQVLPDGQQRGIERRTV